MKEYGVCFTSNDGKEVHIAGHYRMIESAEASAETHRKAGNRNVYVIEREIGEWKRVKEVKK